MPIALRASPMLGAWASRAVVAATLALGATSFGTGAAAQTLEQAMAAAYRTNTALLSQRAAQRAIDENVPQALSNWRPQVTFGSLVGVGGDSTVQSGVFSPTQSGQRVPRQVQVQVSQPVYRGGRTVAGTSQAENQVLAGRATLALTEQQVFLDTVNAYANVLTFAAVLELNQNNVQVLTRQFEAARDRFTVGEVTRTDVAQAEGRLAGARADVIQSQGNLENARVNYFRVVGDRPGRLVAVRLPQNLPTTQDEAVALADTHPSVVAAQYNEAAARDNVRLIFGELLPNVQLQGTVAHQFELSQVGRELDTGQLLLSMTTPLYSGGSVESRVRQARQIANQRRIDLENARRLAREQSSQQFIALVTARARVRALLTQIRALEIALDGVEQEARVGSRTTLDVLDAEQELLNGKVNLVQTQQSEIFASYQLAAAVGRLTASDMHLQVNLYDPTEYYNANRTRWFGFGGATNR
jgi:TolC family type I secretion outer membrane protein